MQTICFCRGDLFEYQARAVETLLRTDTGVLVAPTGTGKTVVALNILAARQLPALILVHRSTLIDQWIQSLCMFIPELKPKDIGVLGAGRKKLKGKIDIAMLQSVSNQENIEELTACYDFLIIDECHRVPTVTFEPVLKSIASRSVLGLTATPQRKDRYESIIYMQCGPIAHTVEDIHRATQSRLVYFRDTQLPDMGELAGIHQLWKVIVESAERNEQITGDIISLLEQNRSPLIISDRIEHIEELGRLVADRTDVPVLSMTGSTGKKDRRNVTSQATEFLEKDVRFCLLATGSLIGEGFDLPSLDTMVMAMPISFRGRLTQYVGRLHRQNGSGMKEIVVYDYVDTCSGIPISMFKKRLSAYKKLGYIPKYDPAARIAKWIK